MAGATQNIDLRALARDRRVALAGGALGLASLVLLWSVFTALRLTPTESAEPPRFLATDSLVMQSSAPSINVPSVVGLNVFAADRSAPLARYRLDGEDPVAIAAEPALEPSLPVVVGTAVGTGRASFAMCSLDDSPTMIVRVGDKIGDYTVRVITRGVVEFSTPSGERISVSANPS